MKTQKSELQQLKDKTFILNLTVTLDSIKKEYQEVLKEVQKNFESKGFRKGKAPLETVKANVSEDKIISEIFTHLVSHLYQDKVTELKLKPVVDPKVKIVNPPLTLDKDWQVELTSCELPTITIDKKYRESIVKVNKSQDDEAKKLDQIFDTLLKFTQVELPPILIEADVNRHLSDLVDQTKQAGLTVTQYLKSRNETIEDYEKKLELKVKNEWAINLAISQIALDEKLVPQEKDVEDIMAKNPQLKTNPNLAYYLLTQQKVIDFLKKIEK